MKRSKAETDTPIVPQMTVPQMLMMMQPYQLQNMLQLNASNGMIPSAGAQLPAKPRALAQVPPQQMWLQALNGKWKYVDVYSTFDFYCEII